jgi:hypothetical protein
LLSGNPLVSLKLRYDAKTGKLTFIGQMTENELAILLNPTAVQFDPYGEPLLDEAGNTVTRPVTLSGVQKQAFEQLFTDSQSASLGDNGLAVSGPGQFIIHAHDIDLGISGGISAGIANHPLLARTSAGTSIQVTTEGDIAMTATRISNESLLGGISLEVGGKLDVGGQFSTFGDAASPKGIFTASGGDISVVAQHDVNVNGSRIATYNGGNITVTSLHGDVYAGSGGSGKVSFRWLDASGPDGAVVSRSGEGFGSGIQASATFGSQSPVGNITVKTPEGSILANAGGILQLAFNGIPNPDAAINLTAGIDIQGGDSGVIGNNLNIKAGRNVDGLLVGTGETTVAGKNVNVVAIGGTGVSISAEGSIKGTVISGGALNVSGESISAALVGNSVNAQGDTSSAAVGVPKSNVASVDTKVADDASTSTAKKSDDSADEEEKRRRSKFPVIVRTIGRVRVFLQGEPGR